MMARPQPDLLLRQVIALGPRKVQRHGQQPCVGVGAYWGVDKNGGGNDSAAIGSAMSRVPSGY